MKNKKHLLTFVLAVLLPVSVYAGGEEDLGTSASSFLKIGAGAPTAQALGNAYVSIAEGSEALFWNPAGIAGADDKEFQFSYLDWLQGYKARTLAYVTPMGGGSVLGITANYMDLKDFNCTLADGTPCVSDDIYVRNFIGSLSLAHDFYTEIFKAGVTAKYITENNDGSHYTNMAFDIGGIVQATDWLSLGLAFQNLGDSKEVPTVLRLGGGLHSRYLTVSVEMAEYADDEARYGIGVEVHVPEDIIEFGHFGLRVGYYTRDSHGLSDNSLVNRLNLADSSKISFGFGLDTGKIFGYGVSIDYAMTPYGALGEAHQLGLGIQW
ncbi:MAG: PorV/PorQ family protein [Elusimicrobiaceae bacterium]|jgi:hypothetical protein|nr:PorV/PorQ family protein [Elusimicrobiaceae bacterium]MBT3954627.1 PorV/PorQ family protein [Elusimicrobiaceae bacterium]MBT4007935.1 PorV/PorQ family protein [Elusimicrobiaceae bacterium]MBT4403139.1 PorV/PorQ family protein [Elusimicrobiaceae bacterium]MBT4439949.1 PorV/PorQ family protein [Elusimicrobiaceae bacterium]